MRRRSLLFVSIVVSAVAVSIIIVNRFLASVPDGVVRGAGILLMIGLLAIGYGTVRAIRDKRVKE
ncbi:MAG: hypothetical protein JW780_06715 [Clostridiales bacterium]|nr:hypothetical protein [Clostridiales bacterium]